HVGLMAYSPLAAGLLSGKYEDGIVPPGSRASINPTLFGRRSAASAPVVTAYVALARQHGLDPAQMALAFCMSRPFMASTIIGATSMRQLATDVAAAELKLSAEVMEGIAAIHRRHPIPL
ncbi:MAG TPA: aldo/keto reductase, partial [Amaricoccus sp.]|nr:aldo/keto reductase [Amaricoccus sp.]